MAINESSQEEEIIDHILATDPELLAVTRFFNEENPASDRELTTASGETSGETSDLEDVTFSDEGGERLILTFLAAQTPRDLKRLLRLLFTSAQIEHLKKRAMALYLLERGDRFTYVTSRLQISPTHVASLRHKLQEMPVSVPTHIE